MAQKKWTTSLSSSGKVEYGNTNYVAFMEKESVHADFHPLMDFLRNSPVSYALTASPIVYAEIVQEMWTKADCTPKGEIKFIIKGNSYIITSSVINEALHLPVSNFEKLPTDEEIISMLKSINYAWRPWQLSQLRRKYLRKEWSYFFDTLTRAFAPRCGGYNVITRFIQKIAYSLMYGRTIDIGALLIKEFSTKLGDVVINRGKVVFYARFLMIIANYLCKELSVEDRDDTLQVFMQSKGLFSKLVTRNVNGKVPFVLPRHVQEQLCTLSSSLVPPKLEDVREDTAPPTQVVLPSQSQSGGPKSASLVSHTGKRKKTTSPTITEDDSQKSGTASEIHSQQKKKKNASEVNPVRSLSIVNHEMQPGETSDGVVVMEPNSPEEEEKLRCDLLFLLDPALNAKDRQHLLDAAAVFKSNLVACLTSSADTMRTKDMINLASRCYNILGELGDDYTSFHSEIEKLITQHQKVEFAAKDKGNWSEWDIKPRYIHQVQFLSEAREKLSSAQDKLSTAETEVDLLKFKKQELTDALQMITEELYEQEERVKNLTAERDQFQESHSDIEIGLVKLDAEKEEASVAFEAYNTAKEEFKRMSNDLLQLVKK